MNKLEEIVNHVLEDIKPKHTTSTFASRQYAFHRLLRFAKSHHFTEPCQALYDAYTADDKGSPDIRFQLNHVIRLVDKAAGTLAVDKNGKYYNEPPLPTAAEATTYFEKATFPVSPYTDMSYLIVFSEQLLKKLDLSASTVGQYRHAWLELRQYGLTHNRSYYEKDWVIQYIEHVTALYESGKMNKWKWKIRRKSASVLMDVAETGSFHWDTLTQHNLSCGEARLDLVRDRFVSSLQQKNLEPSYVSLCEYVFRYALKHANIHSYEQLSELNSEAVARMLDGFSNTCSKRSMTTIVPILRTVLRYLSSEQILSHDYSCTILTPFFQKNHLCAYIPLEEDERLWQALGTESARDRAILLLALQLGLRDSDICSLKLSSIDWRHDCLRITQKKTNTPLCLPLLPAVGNALMEYILTERPKTAANNPYVFLRKQAPHQRIQSAYHTCSRFLVRHNIRSINGTGKGLHLFRYTLTHRLLRAKVPHQVITDVLGHKSKESQKPYLTMEADMLRMCALDLSLLPSTTQTGGCSHE